MKKNKRMSDILKRILCAVMVLCMVVPNVMAYAASETVHQEIEQEDDESAKKVNTNLDEKDDSAGKDSLGEEARSQVRALGDEEVSVSVSDVYYMSGDSDGTMASIPKDEESGAYLLTEDILAEGAVYGINLNLNMAAGENGWDIINGDTYQMSLDNGSGDGLVEFVTEQGGSVTTNDGIEIGTYVVDEQSLIVTFNDKAADVAQNTINAKINVKFVVDRSNLSDGANIQKVLSVGSICNIKLVFLVSKRQSDEKNKNELDFQVDNKQNLVNENTGNTNILTGNIAGQSTWNNDEILDALGEKFDYSHIGEFAVKLSNNIKTDKISNNVSFEVNSSLNMEYLSAIYKMRVNEEDEEPFDAEWWEKDENREGLAPLEFSVKLGDIWSLPGVNQSDNSLITNEPIIITENNLHVATAVFSEDTDKQLTMTITYNPKVIYYNHNNVKMGLGYSLSIREDKLVDIDSYEVWWNDNKEITLVNTSGSGGDQGDGTGFEISKTVAGGSDSTGKNTIISDSDFTYQIQARKWKKTVDTESEIINYIPLAGAVITDTIPSGLEIVSVKKGDEFLIDGTDYSLNGNTFTYTCTETDGIQADRYLNLFITVKLDETAITEVASTGKKEFKNLVSISSSDVKEPQTAEQTTTVKKVGLDKEGSVNSIDGSRVNWTITATSYFSDTVDSYIVDRINGNVQTYDLNTIKIDGNTPLTVNDLSDTPLSYDLYESVLGKKDNQSGAEQIRELLQPYNTTENEAYLFKAEYDEGGTETDYVLVIPYAKYHNGTHRITYDTILSSDIPDKTEVKNDVTLVWDHKGGEGPGSFEWNVSINKGPSAVGDLVKEGVTYDAKTQTATWRVRINPLGKELGNTITIKDIFENGVQDLIEGEKQVVLEKHTRNNDNFEFVKSEIPLNKVSDNPSVNQSYTLTPCDVSGAPETNGKYSVLTVPLDGTNSSNTRYFLNFKIKIQDPSILASQGDKKIENKISLSYPGSQEDITAEGKIDYKNILIEKDFVKNGTNGQTYDYSTNKITWQVTMNVNDLPMESPVLEELLPFGSTLTGWKVSEGTDDFVEPDKTGTSTLESGVTITRGTTETIDGEVNSKKQFYEKKGGEFHQRKETFTFAAASEESTIDRTYTFQFTTQFNDEEFLKAFLMSYDSVSCVNKATLTGKIYGGDIDASAIAEYEINPKPVIKSGIGTNVENNADTPDYITWTVDINRSRANIQGTTIYEDFSNSGILELDPESIECYEMTVASDGGLSLNGDVKHNTVNADGTISIDDVGTITCNPDLQGFNLLINDTEEFKKCIRLTFKTYISDDVLNAADLTNKVIVSQKGNYQFETANIKSDYKVKTDFSAWASASPSPLLKVRKYANYNNEDNDTYLWLSDAEMKLKVFEKDEKSGAYAENVAKGKVKKTNKNGYATFICLQEEYVYELSEYAPPLGYSQSDEKQYFMFLNNDAEFEGLEKTSVSINGKEVDVRLIRAVDGSYSTANRETKYGNTPSDNMSISIHKLGGDSKDLAGVTFELRHTSEALIGHKAVTDGTGVVSFNQIEPGEYTLSEKVPDGLDEYYEIQPITFTISADKNTNSAIIEKINNPNVGKVKISFESNSKNKLLITNHFKSGSVKLKKVESGTGSALSSAMFKIYEGTGVDAYSSTALESSESNEEGVVSFDRLPFNPYGYKILEEKAPEGYVVNTSPTYITAGDMRDTAKGKDSFLIDLTGEENKTKYINDERILASISFDKYVAVETGTNEVKLPLRDRTFRLIYIGGDSYISNTNSFGFQMDTEGKWYRELSKSTQTDDINKAEYRFENIPLGEYKLIETSSESQGDVYSVFEKTIDLKAEYLVYIKKQASSLLQNVTFEYKVNSAGADDGTVINRLLETDIILNKTDSITGELVDGAEFVLSGFPAEYNIEYSKDCVASEGRLTITGVPVGKYTLTEKTVPENYVKGADYIITIVSEYNGSENKAVAYIKSELDTSDGLGTICSNPNEPYAIPNDAITGSLSLTKLGKGYTDSGADSEGTAGDTVVLKDGLPISGAAFKLLPVVEKGGKWVTVKETDEDGNVKDKIVSEGITKEDGSLTFEELPYCDYLLIEETPDGYYAMDPVLLKKDYFVISKSDEPDTMKTFQWNGKHKKVTVDGNGDYAETEAEEDFSSEQDDVNIITDIPVVLDASFTKILIDNVEGEDGNILTDAKFTVERLGSGGGVSDETPFENAYDLTKSFVSYVPCSEVEPDDVGVVTINNLICGIYKITETEWTAGSRPVDAEPIVVMYLKVARNDEGGFSVWRYKAIKDGELADNSDDVINVDRLESKSAYMGVVANSPYNLGMVNFTKAGTGGSKPLVGAIFGLYRKDKETNEYSPVTMYPDGENVITVTGDRGTGIFQYLTYGSYAIKELKAPEGHILDNTYYEFEISENNLTGSITNLGISDNIITNKQNSYQIQKQDMSRKLLNGAIFTVTGRFANVAASTTKTYTVNGTSALIAGELVAGESYVIKETAAPAGYSIAAPITVTIDENGQLKDSAGNAITDNKVIIKDEMIDMGLYKVSAENFSSADTSAVTRLEGAEFAVSPITGSSFADGSKSITINDQNFSTAFKGKLVADNSYTVTETKAPYGYTLAAPFTFSVNANGGVSIASTARNYVKASTSGQLVIYVADEQGTGDVTLVKKDAGSSEELPGAGFKLYRKSTAGTYALVADKILYTGNTYKMTGTSAIDNGTANSPVNGKLTVSGLPWGSYQFVEVEAPAGYVLDGTPYTFDITGSKANGMSVDLGTVMNQKTAVKVSKVDESSAALSGATLAILNSDGKEEERWVTDGTVHIISGLIPGATYKLHEVKAPAGYELADDITFTLPANGQYELSMTDIKKPIPTPTPGETTGSVVVTKTVFYEGKPWAVHDLSFYVALYSDADLTNRVSEIVELAFTGSYSTTATFDNLPLGTYYVAEVDEFGDVYDGSDIGMEVEVIDQQCVLTQTSPRGSAVIKNTMPELPDGFYIDPTGKLTVTKKVLNKDRTEATVKNTSFYVTLFSDEDYLLAVSDPMELEIANGSSGTVIFDELALGTYYLAETDEDGFPVDAESDDFAYTPSFSKDTFEIVDENQSVELILTNTLKKGETAPTATPKATVTTKPGIYSSSPARSTLSTGASSAKAANAKTGDETPVFWYFALLAAASAGIILTVSRKRRKMK